MARAPLRLATRWVTWSGASANRRILAAALTVGGVTLVVNLVVAAKDLVIAYRFGTSDAVDAFLIAWVLPAFLLGVVGDTFSAALIPTYVAVRDGEGKDQANELFQRVLAWSVAFMVVVTVALWLASPWLLRVVASRFDEDKFRLTRQMFVLFLPCLLLSGVATIWGAVINAGERFASVSLAAVAVPVGALLGLVAGAGRWGIPAVAVGTTVGYLLRCAWLAAEMRRRIGPWLPRWGHIDAAGRRVIRQYVPTAAASLLMTSTLIVDQSMAARLPPGSVASLTYGIKVVAFAVAFASLALGTAVLPHLSAMVARADWRALRRTITVYSRLVFVSGAVAAAALYFASGVVVRLLYQRGAFSPDASRVVADVQAFAALQIPFYLVGTLLVRVAFALQRSQVLFVGTLISVPLNVVLNQLFMQRWGVAGIALSTSCVYLVSAGFLWMMLVRPLRAASGAADG